MVLLPSQVGMSLVALAIALPASAQFRKPEDAVKYRQSVMSVMATHLYGRLGAMVNGRVPFDAKAAADHATIVATLAPLPWSAFLPGTDVGNSDAKPAAWKEQAKFKELGDKMQGEVLKLQAASRTGDFEAVKSAYRATTGSCKACHDVYTSQ
jgi:cytochrome c556